MVYAHRSESNLSSKLVPMFQNANIHRIETRNMMMKSNINPASDVHF